MAHLMMGGLCKVQKFVQTSDFDPLMATAEQTTASWNLFVDTLVYNNQVL